MEVNMEIYGQLREKQAAAWRAIISMRQSMVFPSDQLVQIVDSKAKEIEVWLQREERRKPDGSLPK